MEQWPTSWLPKAYSSTWFLLAGIAPVMLMMVLYSKVVHTLWFQREGTNSQNIRQVLTPLVL